MLLWSADEIAEKAAKDRSFARIAEVVDWAGLNVHAYWGLFLCFACGGEEIFRPLELLPAARVELYV